MSGSDELFKAVSEIRDLLRLLAEPAIAERDRKLRSDLARLVGASKAKQKAIFIMDGAHTQASIVRESFVNQGHLSTLVKALKAVGLVSGDTKLPKLAIAIPAEFFEKLETK